MTPSRYGAPVAAVQFCAWATTAAALGSALPNLAARSGGSVTAGMGSSDAPASFTACWLAQIPAVPVRATLRGLEGDELGEAWHDRIVITPMPQLTSSAIS